MPPSDPKDSPPESRRDLSRREGGAIAALSIHLEPLVVDARVAVFGDGGSDLANRLLELNARSVHVFDPDSRRASAAAMAAPRGVTVRPLDDFDVRDGAFDLAVIPDIGALDDPEAVIGRLRRAVDAHGAVVAMGRARTEGADSRAEVSFPDVAPATLEYGTFYDLFALQFEEVSLAGVVPFMGVVFAELGGDEDVAVSVDTRLAPPPAPDVFVIVASREPKAVEPYAIVQVDSARRSRRDPRAEAQIAEAQLRSGLLAAQLDEARQRLAVAESRSIALEASCATLASKCAMLEARAGDVRAEGQGRLGSIERERDAAMARATELEVALIATHQSHTTLERRLLSAEQGMLERDDQIATLHAELDSRRADERSLRSRIPDEAALAALVSRAQEAEAALALNVADLAHVAEAHASETASLEAQLRERAKIIASLEKEVLRREHLVRELVGSLEEAREGGAVRFEAAPPPVIDTAEVDRYKRKLDELALENARREGELVAQAWRIGELEAAVRPNGGGAGSADLERELARTRDELDALRQALTQEHAARVAAEAQGASGEDHRET